MDDPTKSAATAIQLTPAWQTQDIGNVNAPGSYSYANGAYTVTGSGDLYLTADAFRYVWQSLTGDGAIIARVNISGCCLHPEKAGLMIRDSLSPDARMVFQGLYSGIVGLLHSRSTAGGSISTQFGATGIYWIRLVRTGNFFTGYLSNDGVAWSQVGSVAVPMGTTVYAGLAAISTLDPAKSASVVVQLGAFVPVRVNAGGPSHIDPTGVFWNGDTGYDKGIVYSAGATISNTLTPYLYLTEHFYTGAFQYQFYVPNGTYQVKLKFAEIYFTQAGQRVFNVAINGVPQLTSYDIVADAGAPNRAADKLFIVPVSNGQIKVEFTPVISNPKIDAIEITP